MTKRFYIMPAARVGNETGLKYFKCRVVPDPLIPLDIEGGERADGMKFGGTDLCLAAVALDQARHDFLVAQPDVVGVPDDLETLVSEAAAAELQSMGLPVDANEPWRDTLRRVKRMFEYAQRFQGVTALQGMNRKVVAERGDARTKAGGRAPDTTLGSLTRADQLALLLAAELHGMDAKTLDAETTTVADMLKSAGEQREPVTLWGVRI